MIQKSTIKNSLITPKYSVAFDLDDTIYYEQDYVFSGFQAIGEYLKIHFGYDQVYQKLHCFFLAGLPDPIEKICEELNLTIKEKLVDIMRKSPPKIALRPGVMPLLGYLKENNFEIGIITNGRSSTQRMKIEALKIQKFLDICIISEETTSYKPNHEIFMQYQLQSMKSSYLFIGNNPGVDINPARAMGWKTIHCTSNNLMLKKYDLVDADWYISNFRKDSVNNIFRIDYDK